MVKIVLPPPTNSPLPIFYNLSKQKQLIRIFDPTKYNTQAITFRYFGPIHRFDHHRGSQEQPQKDTDRGIYYTAFTLSSCLVEYYGDLGVIETENKYLALINVTQTLKLLDLRGSGAMKAGTVAALAKTDDRKISQAWSRYFYDEELIYDQIDGIIYFNAHNDEEAIALYERAINALSCPPNHIFPLNDLRFRSAIQSAALKNNLIFKP